MLEIGGRKKKLFHFIPDTWNIKIDGCRGMNKSRQWAKVVRRVRRNTRGASEKDEWSNLFAGRLNTTLAILNSFHFITAIWKNGGSNTISELIAAALWALKSKLLRHCVQRTLTGHSFIRSFRLIDRINSPRQRTPPQPDPSFRTWLRRGGTLKLFLSVAAITGAKINLINSRPTVAHSSAVCYPIKASIGWSRLPPRRKQRTFQRKTPAHGC